MNPEAAVNLPPALPIDDEAISRALKDLDSKMAAWVDMVSVVQDRLSSQVRGLPAEPYSRSSLPGAARVASAPAVANEPLPDETPTPGFESIAGLKREPTGRATRDYDSSLDQPGISEVTEPILKDNALSDDAAEDDGGEAAQALQAFEPDASIEVTEALNAEFGETAPNDGAAAQETETDIVPDSDEALLRTLDPEMARAIRARFRLFNGMKTIGELIEEFEPDAKIQKRSWWGRKK